MTPTYDVLIAGAGPVGLFLACKLHLVGLLDIGRVDGGCVGPRSGRHPALKPDIA